MELVIFKGVPDLSDPSYILQEKDSSVVLTGEVDESEMGFEFRCLKYIMSTFGASPLGAFQSPGDYKRHWLSGEDDDGFILMADIR